jgi:hypothetical protein
MQLLIRKDDTETLDQFRKAINAAFVDGKGILGGTPLKKANPLKDGDEEKDTTAYPEFAGHWYLNVSTKKEPTLYGPNARKDAAGKKYLIPLTDPAEWYSGIYVRARVGFTAYDYKENGASLKKGITAILLSVQKTRDGEPLGGGYDNGSSFLTDDTPVVEDDLGFVEIL